MTSPLIQAAGPTMDSCPDCNGINVQGRPYVCLHCGGDSLLQLDEPTPPSEVNEYLVYRRRQRDVEGGSR